jgi:hypothetical protein
MTTQDFISDLWVRVLPYKNEAIFQSHNPEPTERASTTNLPQSTNQDISKGNSVNGYRAPVQIIQVHPSSTPPRFRERNQLDPMEQREVNLAMERIAVPDPRMNITGTHVPTDERLENMGIQTANFNYPAIMGIVGILVGIVAIVWLARGRKG